MSVFQKVHRIYICKEWMVQSTDMRREQSQEPTYYADKKMPVLLYVD